MKKCFKCHELKPLTEFYKHPRMSDGHVNKCKECNKADVIKNRRKNVEYYRAYDRERGNRAPDNHCKIYRDKNPEKYKAHSAVNYALRSGRLKKKPCAWCGSTEHIHGHHEDYSKPLDVVWLCTAHHSQVHKGRITIHG